MTIICLLIFLLASILGVLLTYFKLEEIARNRQYKQWSAKTKDM